LNGGGEGKGAHELGGGGAREGAGGRGRRERRKKGSLRVVALRRVKKGGRRKDLLEAGLKRKFGLGNDE